MKKVKRTALYIRVSTTEQAQEGYSIGEQKERLEQYVKAMGWIISGEYIDPGFSGSNTDRPALNKLIDEINQHDIVLVYKLDRLSRSQKDTMLLIEDVFLKNDVDFVSMSESFDTSTPFGRAAIGLLATFAQLERENIKERMTMGMRGRAKKGYWKGTNRPPIGYDYIDGNLIINDYEAIQIRELYSIAANGIPGMNYNVRNMARYLSEKYTNKYGNWSDHSGISYTIHNKVYIGFVKYNDDFYPGQHQPIVDNKLFEKANARLDSYLSQFGEHVTYNKYMLSGITYCGICGKPYYRRNSQTKLNGIKKEYGYYSCEGRKSNVQNKCPSKIFQQKELEQSVVNQIQKLKYHDFKSETIQDNTSILLNQVKALDIKQERLIDLYSIGSISKDQINDRIKALNSEREKIKTLLSRPKKLNTSEILSISSQIEESDYSTKCDMVHTLVDKVIIDGNQTRIYWRF